MRIRNITANALLAALYASLTIALGFISYGNIQFRVAEILTLLVFFNRSFIPGLTIGAALAGLASPYGALDMLVGTSATFIALVLMALFSRINNLALAALWPVIVNGVIIGWLIAFMIEEPMSLALVATFGVTVALGQAVVLYGVGVPLFSFLQKKRPHIIEFLKKI